jgi:hypothetical protein
VWLLDVTEQLEATSLGPRLLATLGKSAASGGAFGARHLRSDEESRTVLQCAQEIPVRSCTRRSEIDPPRPNAAGTPRGGC